MHKIAIYPFGISYKRYCEEAEFGRLCMLSEASWKNLCKNSVIGKVYLYSIFTLTKTVDVLYDGFCFRIPYSCIDLNNSDDYVKYFILNSF